jgi:hypothetical protein
MDFESAVETINALLSEKRPDTFNSSWILKYSPAVYRFIQKYIRTDYGSIDWNRVTRALERKYHRKWKPAYRTGRTANFLSVSLWNFQESRKIQKILSDRHFF